MPPSGNDLGSFGFNGCLSGSAFSASGGFMSVTGMERDGSIISMLCFHSDANVAEDGVLVELIMMGVIFGAERRWKPLEREREREGGKEGGEEEEREEEREK